MSDRIVLDFRVKLDGQDWQDVIQTVPLVHVPCHHGGTRPYFRCPGVVNGRTCQRRVIKLFAAGRYFLCRHCHRLTYASQCEAPYDRLLRRADKRRVALGGEPGTAHFIPSKPKGMWHGTYDRGVADIERCEQMADRLFLRRFRHFLSESDIARFFDNWRRTGPLHRFNNGQWHRFRGPDTIQRCVHVASITDGQLGLSDTDWWAKWEIVTRKRSVTY